MKDMSQPTFVYNILLEGFPLLTPEKLLRHLREQRCYMHRRSKVQKFLKGSKPVARGFKF